jgi:hypothetical protein
MGTQERLNNYLNSVRNEPFAWGHHDCLTFTNNAFKAMHGSGWADDLLGRYTDHDGAPIGRRNDLRRIFGYTKFDDAVDERLTRIGYVPPRGALVTTKHSQRWVIGVAMGISVGASAVFLSKQGLLYLPIELIDMAWVRA